MDSSSKARTYLSKFVILPLRSTSRNCCSVSSRTGRSDLINGMHAAISMGQTYHDREEQVRASSRVCASSAPLGRLLTSVHRILSQQRPYRKPTEPEWRQPGNWTCPGFVDTWVKLPMLREPIVARTVAA